MLAGELRHRVTIQTFVETRTAKGGTTEVPATLYARIPALVEPLRGRELDVAMQIDPRLRYRISLRYHQGIKAQQGVVYHALDGDRTFEIVEPPMIDEKNRAMELLCGEATR